MSPLFLLHILEFKHQVLALFVPRIEDTLKLELRPRESVVGFLFQAPCFSILEIVRNKIIKIFIYS